MDSSPDLASTFARYAQLIESALPAACGFVDSTEDADVISIDRGAILNPKCDDLAIVDRLIEVTSRAADMQVADRAGHQRAVYRPLLIYAWLTSFARRYESLPRDVFGRWDESLRAWSDALESDLGGGQIDVATSAWTALSLHVAGKTFIRDAWTDLASDTFGRIVRSQTDNGAFLADAGIPELRWYNELAIVHACASFAVQTENRSVARAVARSSDYILREIEPDHATGQPWGIFAFIWNARANVLANQLLHSLSLRGNVDGVALILLCDALYCLRLFLQPSDK